MYGEGNKSKDLKNEVKVHLSKVELTISFLTYEHVKSIKGKTCYKCNLACPKHTETLRICCIDAVRFSDDLQRKCS